MPLPADALDTLRSLLIGDAPLAERCLAVRQTFPGLSLTRCDASDMDADHPVLETDDLSLYLIDTSEHCVRLTQNPGAATGVIVAEKKRHQA